jgi:hypothetical protein
LHKTCFRTLPSKKNSKESSFKAKSLNVFQINVRIVFANLYQNHFIKSMSSYSGCSVELFSKLVIFTKGPKYDIAWQIIFEKELPFRLVFNN